MLSSLKQSIRHMPLVVLVSAVLVCANPSDEHPEAPLAAHGGELAQTLHAEASSLYAAALQETRTYAEAASNGRLARLSGKQLGQTRVKVLQLFRVGQQLQILGEPSGIDFCFGSNEVGLTLYDGIIKKWRVLPTSQRLVNSIRNNFRRRAPRRAQLIESLEKMAADEKWEVAEKELYRALDTMESAACLLSDSERKKLYDPFGLVQSKIDTAMKRLRSETAQQLLTQSRAELEPDFPALQKTVSLAVGAIETTGQANWNDELIAGPKLVEKLTASWKEVHVATLRCRALDWAIDGRLLADDKPSDTTGLVSQYNDTSAVFADAVTKLIAGDTQRLSGDDAAAVYMEYLTSVATLARQVANRSTVESWNQALRQLAAKSSLAAEVTAYEQATSELLRWRAKAAASQAEARADTFPPFQARFVEAAKSKPPFRGLLPARQTESHPPRLLASAAALMPTVSENLIGGQVAATNSTRVNPRSNSAIARYRARTYGTLPAGLDLAAEVDAMEFDLLVSDGLPPLTLGSTVALQTAQRGDFAAVGGEVSGLQLEALITRFATLPTAASVLIPLGELPTERVEYQWISQMMMRFDLEPQWVQHQQFFVELSATD